MWGAIIGDVVGSRFQFNNYRNKDFDLFSPRCSRTDDSVLTIALAETLLGYDQVVDEEAFKKDLVDAFHRYGKEYIDCGFGGRFLNWILSGDTQPYNSLGNGSAMRVSPVAWYGNTLEEVERLAKLSAEVTHNHPEGIKGAVSTAGSIFLARRGKSKEQIKSYVEGFGYDLSTPTVEYRYTNGFDATCPKTIPIALRCFLEGSDFEDVLRTAVSVGGDTDTISAIACSVAEAFYPVADTLIEQTSRYLDKKLLSVAQAFRDKYCR